MKKLIILILCLFFIKTYSFNIESSDFLKEKLDLYLEHSDNELLKVAIIQEIINYNSYSETDIDYKKYIKDFSNTDKLFLLMNEIDTEYLNRNRNNSKLYSLVKDAEKLLWIVSNPVVKYSKAFELCFYLSELDKFDEIIRLSIKLKQTSTDTRSWIDPMLQKFSENNNISIILPAFIKGLEKIAMGLELPELKDAAISMLAAYYERNGNTSKAQELIEPVLTIHIKNKALFNLAIVSSNNYMFETATKWAYRIDNEELRYSAIQHILNIYTNIKRDQSGFVKSIFNSVKSLFGKYNRVELPEEFPVYLFDYAKEHKVFLIEKYRNKFLLDIAEIFILNKNLNKASELIEQVKNSKEIPLLKLSYTYYLINDKANQDNYTDIFVKNMGKDNTTNSFENITMLCDHLHKTKRDYKDYINKINDYLEKEYNSDNFSALLNSLITINNYNWMIKNN